MIDEANPLENTQETMSDASEVLESTMENTASDETVQQAEVVTDSDSSGVGAESANADVATTISDDSSAIPTAEPSEQAVDSLLKDIEALKAQLDDRNSQFMRIAADFDNFRKRTQKEKEDLELHIKCATVVELLPVVDNFERARSQIKPQGEEGLAIHKSYQGVYKDLVDRLKKIGVSPMRSEGKEFDPNLHEAVMREATHDYPEGTVIEELVRGYLLGERVLRHAMVKVAATPEPDEITDQDDQSDSNE